MEDGASVPAAVPAPGENQHMPTDAGMTRAPAQAGQRLDSLFLGFPKNNDKFTHRNKEL